MIIIIIHDIYIPVLKDALQEHLREKAKVKRLNSVRRKIMSSELQ